MSENKIKKIFTILSILVMSLFVAVSPVRADITDGLTDQTFEDLDPLAISGSGAKDELSTPGGVLGRLLELIFPLAGLMLFLLIVWGGFEILASSASQKGIEAGKNRITAAVIGYLLLFSTYWMLQILEVVFGFRIL